MKVKRGVVCLLLTLAVAGEAVTARAAEPLPTIAERTAGLECQAGFLPICWDAREGKLLLEVNRFNEEFLYISSLATGAGSNALGFDRGQTAQALVRFERVGPRVLLVEVNTRYRAQSENAALARGVEEQFPVSVLRGWTVEAEEGGRVLVDATKFFLRDALSVAARLKQAGQGDWALDSADRSALYLPRTKAFPRNTEVEALLTFASDNPGPLVQQVAPDGRSLTVRVHHSFVALPEQPYRPRRFDGRVGILSLRFNDYAQPLDARLEQRWIVRWRLEKATPGATASPPVKPMVYYLDPAMPEPMRSAVREGALWWNKVFEDAGFLNAFEVRDLPVGADPMDARYSIIQWGHRADRGWSWGEGIADPRTGEILKAVVFMDSHRMRTDYNLWAGMAKGTGQSGRIQNECYAGAWGLPDWVAELDPKTTPEEFVLARARQLAAHEVGHTLGLAHNFAASTYGRASVMDYPAPLVKLTAGQVDLSEAYAPGPGVYDRFAIRYAYSVFAPAEQEAQLKRLVEEGLREGILFLTDEDARPAAASDPRANLWDNRASAAADFHQSVAVRQALLEKFSAAAIKEGEPLGLLQERLAPVYFHHRFALEALVKEIGGMEYVYALRGDGQEPTRLIDPERQREALELALEALKPEALALPESVLVQLAPPAHGYEVNPDYGFKSNTWPAFDELGAARTLATMIVDGVLNRERAARLVAFAGRQEEALTLDEVLESLVDATWGQPWPAEARQAALQRVAQRAVLDRLLALAADKEATVEVRAVAEWALTGLLDDLKDQENPDPVGEAMRQLAERDITRFLNRTAEATEGSKALEAPAGSPIGH
ncbi:MAG TPA: zinc-dependent metalloprotease [Candidatus Acidoferrales bacterium]|nr:zinc-dependent metalloprotease [Candidatus Acidoferrales bacterium]